MSRGSLIWEGSLPPPHLAKTYHMALDMGSDK